MPMQREMEGSDFHTTSRIARNVTRVLAANLALASMPDKPEAYRRRSIRCTLAGNPFDRMPG